MAFEHAVQFHDNAAFLSNQVAEFLAPALERGTAIAVARATTLDEIEAALVVRGFDAPALRASGRLQLIEATEMLARIVDDEMPERTRFEASVGELIARSAEPVRVYGEMVDVLWQAGQRDAMLRLEELWAELGARRSFSLLCGYRLAGFAADHHIHTFELVCSHHDHVLPTERVAAMSVAELEQRARALELEVRRRKRIERRMELLLELGSELACARSRDEIARIAIDKGRDALGAVECAVWELDTDASALRLLGSSEPSLTNYTTIPLDGDAPITRVVRASEPLFIGSCAEFSRRFPGSYERYRSTQAAGEAAFAVLPIMVDAAAFGGIVYRFDHARTFEPADRAFKAILARNVALAIERVANAEQEHALRLAAERAAADEKRAREDVELLYGLIDALNRIDDISSVFEIALRAAERGAASDRSAVLLFDESDRMRFQAWHGLSDEYRAAVDGHSPWSRDTRDPVPVWVDDTDADPAWLQYRPVFRAEGIRALAFVPLINQGTLVGKLMLYRNEPRAFTVRELQLAATIAVHVAQAVVRKRGGDELARAYREERAAHLEAEEATRAREEILSVVSHDLRNPLGTVMMGATTLLQLDIGDKGHRVRTVAERIHRQAERMARLIEDLVDFAGIQAGRLAIQPSEHAPGEIISATCDIFAPLAEERGLTFEAVSRTDLPRVRCDSDRAVQVMSNLVANALKVTPKGGRIAIGAEPKAEEVVFFVRDTGPGIDPEELPQLFERYWRSKTTTYKGAGLGLSIARGIVDAHGGRIWAESQLGTGSCFYFSLSSLRSN